MIVVAGLALGPARAQLALPGAAPSEPSAVEGAGAPKPKPKRRLRRAERPARPEIELATVVGRTLKLNGRLGELELARGDDDTLKIVKLTLMGEVVSNPAQECRIDIVAATPIEAKLQGEPDGLHRYAADIPACPFAFDVVDDAVIVPAQSNACVFSAADCQASPSGLWGPELAELDKDREEISKSRAAADRDIQASLRDLEKRDKDAADSLEGEQNDFAASRDDVCHDYAGETRLGFCASRLAQSRAALLAKRVAEASPGKASEAKKRHRKDTP